MHCWTTEESNPRRCEGEVDDGEEAMMTVVQDLGVIQDWPAEAARTASNSSQRA